MPQRVLVVEDDPDTAALLSLLIRTEGYEAHVVATLHDARAALADVAPALVVLDLVLPDGDGLALCADLRGRRPMVPFVVLTARVDASTRAASLAAGCTAYIAKPFELEEIVAEIRAAIGPP
ncbi:MAG TPA: response regulator transcription factor [Thermodesulfobacteriota bacterium]